MCTKSMRPNIYLTPICCNGIFSCAHYSNIIVAAAHFDNEAVLNLSPINQLSQGCSHPYTV